MPGTALIIEDHPLYRDALVHLLEASFGKRVLAATTAEEALKLGGTVDDLRLVVLDPGLPGLTGAEAISACCKAFPDAALIAVSASEDRRDAASAFRAGALAFVSKAAATEVLAGVVERALAGELNAPEWVLPSGACAEHAPDATQLTARQREILVLLCQGHANKEISLRLGLAEVTVKMHLSAIFRALGVASRTQAVIAARRLGLHPA